MLWVFWIVDFSVQRLSGVVGLLDSGLPDSEAIWCYGSSGFWTSGFGDCLVLWVCCILDLDSVLLFRVRDQ